MSSKLVFAGEAQRVCTAIIAAFRDGYDQREVYNDRGYPPAGGDPITDGDLTNLGITAADVEAAMQFFENLQKMLDGEQVTVADYRNSLNKMRTDV